MGQTIHNNPNDSSQGKRNDHCRYSQHRPWTHLDHYLFTAPKYPVCRYSEIREGTIPRAQAVAPCGVRDSTIALIALRITRLCKIAAITAKSPRLIDRLLFEDSYCFLTANPNNTRDRPLKNKRMPMSIPIAQAPESGNCFQIMNPSNIDNIPLNATPPQPLTDLI